MVLWEALVYGRMLNVNVLQVAEDAKIVVDRFNKKESSVGKSWGLATKN